MNRRILALVAAFVLAITGAFLVMAYVKGADSRAIADAQPTTVWVTQKLVPAGTTLKDAESQQLITKTQVAAQAMPTGALQTIATDNESLVALSNIAPGQYVLSTAFGDKPIGTSAITVPTGMVAVSVELSDPARVGQWVTPGSHITIYASNVVKSVGTTTQAQAFNSAQVNATYVLLPDVEVIAMGQTALQSPSTANKAATSGGSSFLVTVAVSPADSLRLIHGVATSNLYAALDSTGLKVDPNGAVSDLDMVSAAAKARLESAVP